MHGPQADFPPELAIDDLVEKLVAEGVARFGLDVREIVRAHRGSDEPYPAELGDAMQMLGCLRDGAIVGPTSPSAIGAIVWLEMFDPEKLRRLHLLAQRMEREARKAGWLESGDRSMQTIEQAHRVLHEPRRITSQAPPRRPDCSPCRSSRGRRPGGRPRGRSTSKSAAGSDPDGGEPGEARHHHLDHLAQLPQHSLPKRSEARCAT